MNQFVITFGWCVAIAHIMVWVYPHFWRAVGDPLESDTMGCHNEISLARCEEEEKETAMREFKVIVRPFAGTFIMYDPVDESIPMDDYAMAVETIMMDGEADEYTVCVQRYEGRLHSFSTLDYHNEGKNWSLWASEFLSDETIYDIEAIMEFADKLLEDNIPEDDHHARLTARLETTLEVK